MTNDILVRVKKELGGNAGIALALGDLTPQAVSQWKRIPPTRVGRISELTGIAREELRPDVFGAPEAPQEEPEANAA